MARRPISIVTCLLAPLVILILGVTFAAVHWTSTRPDPADEAGRGPLPPGFSADITENGKHTVWLHTHAVYQERVYESRDRLPDGARLVLIDETSGKTLDFSPVLGPAMSRSFGSDLSVEIGSFFPLRPGQVTVRGSGFPNPVILSVGPSRLAENMSAMLTVTGILIVTLFFSLVCLIILLHRRKKMIEAKPGEL